MGLYKESYVYDAVGNIRTMQHRGTNPEHPGWTRTYAYNEDSLIEPPNRNEPGKISNRLSSTQVGNGEVESYAYDAHGSMTTMPHLPLMQWNYLDRLAATARQVVNSGTTKTTYYVYDAGGQRVRKVTEREAKPSETPTRTKERIYLGGFEIYRVYDADGSTVSLERETLHLMDGQQRVALVETRTQGDDGSSDQLIRYQLGNHLGSVSLELDGVGHVISYEEYFPYGSTSYQAVDKSIKAEAKRYRYTGKERDEETGLAYHSKRYLALWLGRWSSSDPAGLVDGTNVFRSLKNSPIVRIDSNGMFSWSDLQSKGTTIEDVQAVDPTPTTSETKGIQVPYSPEIQIQLNELQQQQQRYLREEALKVHPTELQAIQETADQVSLIAGLIPLPPAQAVSVGADLVSLGVDVVHGTYKSAALGLALVLLPGPSPKAELNAAAELNAIDEMAEYFWKSAPNVDFRDPHWGTFRRFENEAMKVDEASWHAVPNHSPVLLIPDVVWRGFESGKEVPHFEKHGAEFKGIITLEPPSRLSQARLKDFKRKAQADYRNLANTFGSEPPLFTLSELVGPYTVRYNPLDNYLFVGRADNRTIFTFYRPDNRTIDPMVEAIDYAIRKSQ
jgi:RHS repeat-associated protein